MARRLVKTVVLLVIAYYLYALWSDWFTHAELLSPVKRPLFSDYIDLWKAGPITWEVPAGTLDLPEETAHLSLVLNVNSLLEIPKRRAQVDLRLRVRAEGRKQGQAWQDRLVRDEYFRTDEPFSPEGNKLWEASGWGRLEYGLAEVRIPQGEDLRLSLDVQVPDGMLMSGRPRLKLVASHGPGDFGYPPFGRWLLRESGFWLSLAALGWLTISVWMDGRQVGHGLGIPSGTNRNASADNRPS